MSALHVKALCKFTLFHGVALPFPPVMPCDENGKLLVLMFVHSSFSASSTFAHLLFCMPIIFDSNIPRIPLKMSKDFSTLHESLHATAIMQDIKPVIWLEDIREVQSAIHDAREVAQRASELVMPVGNDDMKELRAAITRLHRFEEKLQAVAEKMEAKGMDEWEKGSALP